MFRSGIDAYNGTSGASARHHGAVAQLWGAGEIRQM